ncbi:MAG: hypothetical protein HOP23_03710 [Methylococcaceae bacterium]|nr:hypothetical protein [Methylococcaceae bacterium]
MKTTNNTIRSEPILNDFDSLSQAFVSGSFYGLEYILDDFFEPTNTEPVVQPSPFVDWFGLYNS